MEFQVGRQTFSIPCRRFSIRLTVSNKERLPLVKEFALRYLHVSGSCDAENLRHFFGFSERELGILLNDLRVEGLVNLIGENVALSEKGRDIFRENDAGGLQIQTVEKWNEKFAIDFLSFSIIHFASRSEGFRCFHELVSTDLEKVSRSKEIAKEVFVESFHEYVQRYKTDISNEERANLSIYGISSVESGEKFAFPLSVDLHISSDAPKQVNQRYSIFTSEAAQQKRSRIVHSVSSTLNDLKMKSRFGTNPQWLIQEQLGFGYFSEFVREGRLDVCRTLESINRYRDSSVGDFTTTPIFGSFSLSENANIILDFIRRAKGNIGVEDVKSESLLPSSVFWQKPSSELWGRDDETFSMISRIRREVTGFVAGNSVLNLVFNAKYENPKKLKWRLTRNNNRNVFDNGFETTFGDELCPVEAFLWPGVAGGVLYYYLEDASAEYPVPLGFVTRDPDVLFSLAKFLFKQWVGSGKKVRQRWPSVSGSETGVEVAGREVFSSLLKSYVDNESKGKTLTVSNRGT